MLLFVYNLKDFMKKLLLLLFVVPSLSFGMKVPSGKSHNDIETVVDVDYDLDGAILDQENILKSLNTIIKLSALDTLDIYQERTLARAYKALKKSSNNKSRKKSRSRTLNF